MASIAYIEDRRPDDPDRLPDALVLTGVLYRVESGVFLLRAGAHHQDGKGARTLAAEPYRHEAGVMVVTDGPECRVIRDFIAWFDDRIADWNHALRDGMALYPTIGKDLTEWRPSGQESAFTGGAKVFDAAASPF